MSSRGEPSRRVEIAKGHDCHRLRWGSVSGQIMVCTENHTEDARWVQSAPKPVPTCEHQLAVPTGAGCHGNSNVATKDGSFCLFYSQSNFLLCHRSYFYLLSCMLYNMQLLYSVSLVPDFFGGSWEDFGAGWICSTCRPHTGS